MDSKYEGKTPGTTQTKRPRFSVALYAICVCFGLASAARAETSTPVPRTSRKGPIMPTHASGTFEVKVTPQAQVDEVGDPTVARRSLEKQLDGDLEATLSTAKHSYDFEYALAK